MNEESNPLNIYGDLDPKPARTRSVSSESNINVAQEMRTANLISYLRMRQNPETGAFPSSDADVLVQVAERLGIVGGQP